MVGILPGRYWAPSIQAAEGKLNSSLEFTVCYNVILTAWLYDGWESSKAMAVLET